MNLHDELKLVCNTPWAITREAHETMVAVYRSGKVADIVAAVQARSDSKESAYTMDRGVAVIEIRGVLAKNRSWSADTAYSDVQEQLTAVKNDSAVAAVLLSIDSPGGTVDGCKETADQIRAVDAVKPVYAYADGQMTSAAYYLAAAGRRIAAPETAQIGSIGVVMAHIDVSKLADDIGVKVRYITSGKYKAMGNMFEPLSDEGEGYFQNHIDQTYAIFVNDVARYRGVETGQAVGMADNARIYLAAAALRAGLIDAMVTDRDAFIKSILQQKELGMDLKQLKESHPETYNEAVEQGVARERAESRAKMETAEAEAQAGVLTLVGRVCGDEARDRITGLMKAGVTPEQLDAISAAVPARQDDDGNGASRADVLAALHQATPAAVNGARVPEPDANAQKAEQRQADSDAMAAAANK